MGTQTLGSASNPGSTHFVFFASSGVSFRANSSGATVPTGGIYVDRINVWAGKNSGSATTFKHAIYGTGGSKLGEADVNHSFGTGLQETHSEFSAGHFLFLSGGSHVLAAVYTTGNLQLYGLGNGGSMLEHSGTGFPSPWSTTNTVSSEGDMSWELKYFPPAKITSIPSDPQFPGASVDIVGLSFSAGIISVTVDGIACTDVSASDDTHLSFTLPTNAQTGPVVVTTNAGIATSVGNLTVSGGRVSVGGILVPTSGLRIPVSGVLRAVTRIRQADESLVLKDLH